MMNDSPQSTQSRAELNQLSQGVLDAAFRVHSTLGSGLLESAYEQCLVYDGVKIDAGYRIDLLIENRLIVEVKAVERLLPIHQAQLLTYLKLADKQLGLLINFNVQSLKNGIKRMVYKL